MMSSAGEIGKHDVVEREQHIPLWACMVIGLAGTIVASLPFLLVLPRRVDVILYGLGSMAVGNAVLAACFREIRTWNGRGVIPFQSRARKIAGFVLVIALFLLICGIRVAARAQGWWR